MTTIKDALDNFITDRRLKGMSKKTIRNYREFNSQFLRFAETEHIETLKIDTVNEYILSLYDPNRNLRIATIATYIRHLKAFIHWANEEYDMTFSYSKIQVPKEGKKEVYIYSPEDIKLIFQQVHAREKWIVHRNKAIIALMLDSGLRQSEVCGIYKSDINYGENSIKVHGKGNKERKVPLGRTTERFIGMYIQSCPYEKPYLFVGKNGDQLTPNAIKKFVQKIKSRLPFPFYSHGLRHNFATNYLLDQYDERGIMDTHSLMVLLGHEDLTVTMRYLHYANEVIACRDNISHLDKFLDA